MRDGKTRLAWAVMGAALIVAACILPTASFARRASALSLKQKLNQAASQRKALKAQLRQIKSAQSRAQDKLLTSQISLEHATQQLADSKQRLYSTRREIWATQEDLRVTAVRLTKHSDDMSERLLAAYRGGQPSYAEVLVSASSFEDFVNRADFTKRVAAQDTQVLQSIVLDKQRIEHYKANLQQKQAEQTQLVGRVRQQRIEQAQLAERRLQQKKLINSDRTEKEHQLDLMEQESADIAGQLFRLQHVSRSPSGGGSSSGGSGAYYSGSWSGSLARPVSGRITSPFGWRTHPISGRQRHHDGVDIGAAMGTPIRAAASGVVVHAGWRGGYGNCIIIDHGSGAATLYGHCSRLRVSYGQHVTRGQVIGNVGSTGYSTGPHLHFELRKYGQPVNPL